MKRVYVAGCYDAPNVTGVLRNMRVGIRQSVELLIQGYAPFCPWLDFQFGLVAEVTRKEYLAYSMAYLETAAAVLVLPGWEESRGTKAEMTRAALLGIPTCFSVDELLEEVPA